jgi:hypothetical protein
MFQFTDIIFYWSRLREKYTFTGEFQKIKNKGPEHSRNMLSDFSRKDS